jgi:hypothetical protein
VLETPGREEHHEIYQSAQRTGGLKSKLGQCIGRSDSTWAPLYSTSGPLRVCMHVANVSSAVSMVTDVHRNNQLIFN